MIQLSVPTLAHSTAPVTGSSTAWLHTSVLAITTEAVTHQKEHNFAPQDKLIFRTVYSDILRVINHIQATFPTNPTAALQTLSQLQTQLDYQLR
jgi:cephalosporin-C deacetylase-like acetyl esterase